MYLLIVSADQSVAELALPPLFDIKIPWDDMDATRKSYIPSICNPSGTSTMNPNCNKMSVAEAFHLYEHIISLQGTPTPFAFTPIYQVSEEEMIGALLLIFKFILANSNIYSLLDDHASEEALDERDNPKGSRG